jgi:Fic family protein
MIISLLRRDANKVLQGELRVIFKTPELTAEEEVALERIEELRRELRYYVGEPRRWIGSVRRVLSAKAIQGSNSIEGYNVTDEDAVAAVEGDEPEDAEIEEWQAIDGYRQAMTYVLQLARDEHFEYTPGLIRSLHFMMTEYSLDAGPGLWRPGPIWIRNDATGEVVYEGPEASDVPALINELVSELSTDTTNPPMIRAAMAHLNLLMIHPFRDGNGRMSRCLQTLVLARDLILAPEWSSIEEYLGVSANTQTYYGILRAVGGREWNPEHDARPWLRFCLEAHFIQAASVLRRVQESQIIWERIEALAQEARIQERTVTALFDAALGFKVRNSSYRSALRYAGEDISIQVATSDLKAMVGAGLLAQHGKKRGTFYVATDQVLRIRAELTAKRVPLSADSLFRKAA